MIFKKIIPLSLLGRSIIIIFVPIIVLVIITSIIFYQTSWNIISKRLFENYESVQIILPKIDSKIRTHIYDKCIEINETFTKSGQWKIKFMSNRPFIKYLDKSGIINKKVEKKSFEGNSREPWVSGIHNCQR